jgi:hypothetical protein
VGILDRVFGSPRGAAFAMTDHRIPLKSPFSESSLHRIALAELSGLRPDEVTREEALKVPAVVRGRDLVCLTLGRYPFAMFRSAGTGNPDDDQRVPLPTWLQSTSTGLPVRGRAIWTLDDLFFGAMSVWATERDPQTKEITDAVRVLPEFWNVDPDSLGVQVYGEPAQADQVLIFEGYRQGLLTMCDESVRASRDLANAWQQRVKSPVPLVKITQTDGNVDLTDDEVDDVVLDFEAARQASGTAFVPFGYDAEAMGTVAPDLYVEGRNADRLDWANNIGLPASLLEGSQATATLTYSTQEGRRNEFVDYSLAAWALPIEDRLSQDDVTPAGCYVRFDLTWLLNTIQNGTNPGTED